ncbi:MAG: hypothetical protein EZS28_018947 [Streblomastix strix]|uniref:Uncharacterized protein n=1 Tax=Streblomastix strix TaxID=222440 RepID=A0A5J4VSI9_9EUKA|nr:MAG: hypothetical protein EZS28_018947 [Streblomastix strix]
MEKKNVNEVLNGDEYQLERKNLNVNVNVNQNENQYLTEFGIKEIVFQMDIVYWIEMIYAMDLLYEIQILFEGEFALYRQGDQYEEVVEGFDAERLVTDDGEEQVYDFYQEMF